MASATSVLAWVNLTAAVLPKLIGLVQHYKELSDSPELKETDKKKMKENLSLLSLPNWDDIQ